MLYFRHILILLISLFTVRVVLNTLGVTDYGVYNVIGGVVALFSFLRGTMASATQRFFSFALGEGDLKKLQSIFSVNLVIYVAIAVIAAILLETVGLWYVSDHLKIPPERYDAALSLYHFSVLTFIFNIIAAPFMAMIIAHEDMQIYAYVSIVEAIMKLSVVFMLVWAAGDKLIVYGFLVLLVSAINTLLYAGIALKKYEECQFKKFYWDRGLLKEITSFTGWTLFGQLTTVFRGQAVTILLNQFFNPVVVAARAIASNITGQINVFSANFNTGIYPPIIKSYAANDRQQMFSLIFNGSKMTFFLMWIFALPLFLEMDVILKIWLKTVPEGAVLFTRLALIESLILSISMPITTAARAPGKMREYELILGSMQILIFILDLIVLKLGGQAYSVFVVAIIVNILMFIVRLMITHKLISLKVYDFALRVMFPVLWISLLSSTLSYLLHILLPEGLVYSIITITGSFIFSSIGMFYIGINEVQRKKIIHTINKKIKRI